MATPDLPAMLRQRLQAETAQMVQQGGPAAITVRGRMRLQRWHFWAELRDVRRRRFGYSSGRLHPGLPSQPIRSAAWNPPRNWALERLRIPIPRSGAAHLGKPKRSGQPRQCQANKVL